MKRNIRYFKHVRVSSADLLALGEVVEVYAVDYENDVEKCIYSQGQPADSKWSEIFEPECEELSKDPDSGWSEITEKEAFVLSL